MGKALKGFLVFIIILFVIIGAFIIGVKYGPTIVSGIPFLSNFHIPEPVPNEPYHADDVIEGVNEIVNDDGSGSIELVQQQLPYVVDVDFSPILLKEAQLEKKLIVMTQKATAAEKATKAGLFSLPVFKQTQAIIFHGEGTFFVDLSSLSSEDFVIDDEKKNITIYIPRPQLDVKLVPEETEFFDSSNGMLRFGQMEITPEMMTTLQTKGMERIKGILDSDRGTWETAARFAKLSVKEIYEPLVAAQIDAAVKDADDQFAVPAYYTIEVEIKKADSPDSTVRNIP